MNNRKGEPASIKALKDPHDSIFFLKNLYLISDSKGATTEAFSVIKDTLVFFVNTDTVF